MNKFLTLFIIVAVPLGCSAVGDDHDDDDDKVVCGELELEITMAVTDQHKDEHVVEGIEEGLAAHLSISKSYVHIKFDDSDDHDHSGHGHRRLQAEHLVSDYTITFPTSAADSAVTAASDLLKATKASSTQTSLLISSISTKVQSSIAASGEIINLQIAGGELLNDPSTGHACHAEDDTATTTLPSVVASSCFEQSGVLGFVVLFVVAML